MLIQDRKRFKTSTNIQAKIILAKERYVDLKISIMQEETKPFHNKINNDYLHTLHNKLGAVTTDLRNLGFSGQLVYEGMVYGTI